MNRISSMNARRDILVVSKKSETLMKHLNENPVNSVNRKWITQYDQIKEMKTYTEYSPWWVILMISHCTWIRHDGWLEANCGNHWREKIGKTHLTYAQGASAELIAASTISVSSSLGLPVSTTHVL